MIRAKFGNAILLGLSARNVELLMEKKPIKFDATPLGFNGDIVIVYGATEAAIVKELKDAKLLAPELTLHPIEDDEHDGPKKN